MRVSTDCIVASIETYQERRFDRVASCTNNTPATEEDGSCDGDSDQDGVYVVDLREGGYAPEEIDGG